MPPSTPSVDTIRDRIKLPMTFDVAKMQTEVEKLKLKHFVLNLSACVVLTAASQGAKIFL